MALVLLAAAQGLQLAAAAAVATASLESSPWNPFPVPRGATQIKITSHGAVGDNATLSTAAIQATIDAVRRAGGGYAVVPSGVFLTGTVNLSSNVYLQLLPGGVLQGSADPAHYSWDWDYYHVVQGINVVNSGVVGPQGAGMGGGGMIRGPMWQMIKAYDSVTGYTQQNWANTASGCKGECRPKNLAFIDSTNITVQGVTIADSGEHLISSP